ncbi:hypothetical protein RHA1_ro02742 [Rhodococcus jostii RHA1]|uniref:Uncharacterized protein n=1 Tax=Rhodococcus jostii (strain RHA1) TaxID=101510 RepID=Q0SD39_RHOJR|nr:hypothetical protein RHA1_ro02742 [Rhodococcus jostii RHA1]
MSATGVACVGDVRVSRLPASPCGGAGLTVSHTDARGAGTCCFGVTPTVALHAARSSRSDGLHRHDRDHVAPARPGVVTRTRVSDAL